MTHRKLTLFQFNRIQEILEKKLGFTYDSSNKFILESRLLRILTERKMDVDSYIRNLYSGEESLNPLMEALTINETYFFRESSTLDTALELGREIIKFKKEKLRILCAGCSTGEEGYSLLITLLKGGIELNDIHIDCFDISENAIDIAKKGKYKGRSINNIDKFGANEYFLKDGASLIINTKLREKIRFFTFNILDIDLLKGKYDIIFCRNVLIYFSKEKKENVLSSIFDKLFSNGVLFVGKTESISRFKSNFKSVHLDASKYYLKSGDVK